MTIPSSPPDPQKVVTSGVQREVEQLLHDGFWTPREYQAACQRTPELQDGHWTYQEPHRRPLHTLRTTARSILRQDDPGQLHSARVARAHGWTLTGEVIRSPHSPGGHWPIATPADDEEAVLVSGEYPFGRDVMALLPALVNTAPDLAGRTVCLFVPAFRSAIPLLGAYTPLILNECSLAQATRALCRPERGEPQEVWRHQTQEAFLAPNPALFASARAALGQDGCWTQQEAGERAEMRDLLLTLDHARSVQGDDPRRGMCRAPLLIPFENTTPAPRRPGSSERGRRAWRGGSQAWLEGLLRRAEAWSRTPRRGTSCPA